jgi:cell wall-associated NlpC family hydrolase
VTETFDRRLTPARPEVAAKHLEGRVDARRFVDGVLMQVKEGVVDIRQEPRPDSGLDTQALYGECFTVYDEEEGWAWGQLARDGYVGWIAANTLWSRIYAPTHVVSAPRTFVYPGPSIKLPPLLGAPMGAEFSIVGRRDDFAVTSEGGFVFAAHLAALGDCAQDFVTVAEKFLNVPYLWGGRSTLGIDCSGLVQTSLRAAGLDAPRDTDLQQAALGRELPLDAPLERGDLVFWKGHVGIMRGPELLLHANAHHMLVASEPLARVCARNLERGASDVTAIKRLAP